MAIDKPTPHRSGLQMRKMMLVVRSGSGTPTATAMMNKAVMPTARTTLTHRHRIANEGRNSNSSIAHLLDVIREPARQDIRRDPPTTATHFRDRIKPVSILHTSLQTTITVESTIRQSASSCSRRSHFQGTLARNPWRRLRVAHFIFGAVTPRAYAVTVASDMRRQSRSRGSSDDREGEWLP